MSVKMQDRDRGNHWEHCRGNSGRRAGSFEGKQDIDRAPKHLPPKKLLDTVLALPPTHKSFSIPPLRKRSCALLL